MSIKHRKAARRPRAATQQKRSIWKSCLLTLPITLLAGLLLLLFCTVLLLATDDPNRFSGAAGLAALYLTALIGGMTVGRVHGRRAPLLCGLVTGGMLFLLLTLPSFFLPNAAYASKMQALLIRCPILLITVLGAIWVSRTKKERRRPKRAKR